MKNTSSVLSLIALLVSLTVARATHLTATVSRTTSAAVGIRSTPVLPPPPAAQWMAGIRGS